jgi:hypothetical protein
VSLAPGPLTTTQPLVERGHVMAEGQVTLPALPQQQGVEFCHVAGFPGYCVGSDGSVWSCQKANRYRKEFRSSWRRIKSSANWSGHHSVILYPANQHLAVHRLVLEAFVGLCPEGMQCCHNDGNPANNALSNLRWDTPKANQADRLRHGTDYRGERQKSAKLTAELVRRIRSEVAGGGLTYTEMGRKYRVSRRLIYLVVQRKAWAHVE